jgi:predicted nucleic acid-binding protein
VIVVDASAIVELLAERKAAPAVRRHLASASLASAPEMVDPEVLNGLRRLLWHGLLRPHRAEQAIQDLADLPLQRWRHGPFRARVWELRDRFSPYDALYVVLAEALDAKLLTADKRMARAAEPLVDVALAG